MVTEGGGVALWQALHDAKEVERETVPALIAKETKRPWRKFWK